MGTFLGVPIIRTIVYLGLYWSPLILGNYHLTQLPVNADVGLGCCSIMAQPGRTSLECLPGALTDE